jgi:hypothetical protein
VLGVGADAVVIEEAADVPEQVLVERGGAAERQ